MKKIFLVASLVLLSASSSFAAGGSITGEVMITDASGNPIADRSKSVVFIESVPGKTCSPPKEPYAMASDNNLFVPRVLPILVGSTVTFPNNDTNFHNAFSRSLTKPFDVGHYKKDAVGKEVVFDKTGVVKVLCDIHSKMIGDILVLQNPYFAVTDENGKFDIKDVPPGKFTLVAWQRYGAPVKESIEIGEGANQQLNIKLTQAITLVETVKKDVQHLRKDGRVYKGKY